MLNKKEYERYTNGLGLEAKKPNGSWSLKEHCSYNDELFVAVAKLEDMLDRILWDSLLKKREELRYGNIFLQNQ